MNVFQPVLDKLIDIAGDLDTRYDSASQLCSRLDRIYISLPAWLVTQLHFQSSVASDPHSLHDLKISDHAPAILNISEKKYLKQEELPIPRFVFNSPLYSETLDALVRAAKLDALSVPLRLQKFKQLIREAARISRNETLTTGSDKAQARCTIFSSIARCVWRNDLRLFDVLVRRSSLAASFLVMDGGSVFINDPVKFDNDFNESRQQAMKERIKYAESASEVRRRRDKSASLRRMNQLGLRLGSVTRLLAFAYMPARSRTSQISCYHPLPAPGDQYSGVRRSTRPVLVPSLQSTAQSLTSLPHRLLLRDHLHVFSGEFNTQRQGLTGFHTLRTPNPRTYLRKYSTTFRCG